MPDIDFELIDISIPQINSEPLVEQAIEILPNVEYGGTLVLAQEKIEARKQLLAMPLEKAQNLQSQTLYPQHWSVRSQDCSWEDCILLDSDDDDEAEINT